MKLAVELADKSTLVEREAEVSLKLIELRLKNRLEELLNSNSEMNNTDAVEHRRIASGVMDSSSLQRMAAISALERETKTSLREIEGDFARQVEGLQADLKYLEGIVQSREEPLRSLGKMSEVAIEAQETILRLKSEADAMKKSMQEKESLILELTSLTDSYQTRDSQRRKKFSRAMKDAEELKTEVLLSQQRIQEQDESIRSLPPQGNELL